MKKFVVSSFVALSILGASAAVSADELNQTQEIEFDLRKDIHQEVEFVDENGEDVFLSVERVDKFTSPFMRVSNGTYEISSSVRGAWKASFRVKIKGNKITSADSASATALSGSITSKSLTYSSTTSDLTIKRKNGVTYTGHLLGKIKNGTLSVSTQ